MKTGKTVEFGLLDREAEIDIAERNLPHWFQSGAAMHVTFRTYDSLPKEVVLRMTYRLEEFLRLRKLPPELATGFWDRTEVRQELNAKLSQAELTEFKSLAHRLVHLSLDECHGECHLRNEYCAKIVADAIRYFDGEKFHVDRFVVMPNHVHVLVQFLPGYGLGVIGQSWMRYTGRLINKMLGLEGKFWAREPFDNVMRSPEQFCYTQNYIKQNPTQAKLKPGEFFYWQRGGDSP